MTRRKRSKAIREGLARKRAVEAAEAAQVTVVSRKGTDRRKRDEINYPSHYQDTSMEVADVCEAFNCDWHTGTAIKYLLRAGKKDASTEIADIKKALWYITRRANKKLNKVLLIDIEGNVTHLNSERG